jgi:hypothetical protein
MKDEVKALIKSFPSGIDSTLSSFRLHPSSLLYDSAFGGFDEAHELVYFG